MADKFLSARKKFAKQESDRLRKEVVESQRVIRIHQKELRKLNKPPKGLARIDPLEKLSVGIAKRLSRGAIKEEQRNIKDSVKRLKQIKSTGF